MIRHINAACRDAGLVFLLLVLTSAAPSWASKGSASLPETVKGPGGSEIVFDRRPGSGSVLVAVAVRAGSAWETPETRGVTHLLEHLLFDGSERFTREEISGWADDNGAFLNAFTRKEMTVYFLLVRSDLLEESIEILSQMLLHPVFTQSEIDKERKVVLEEMSKGLDDPRERASIEADRFLYRGSSLTEPVIGYKSTIESVSREGIIEYHRNRYSQGNMRIFVTGDFDRGEAIGWIGDYFSTAGGRMDGKARQGDKPQLVPRWSGEITARVTEDAGNRVDLLLRMPSAGENLFPAALLLADMLGSPSSPLKEAARRAGLPEPSAGIEVHEEFCALRISIEGGEDAGADPQALLDAVTSLAGWSPDEKELETAKISFASSDMFDRESYHLYIMFNGEAMAVAGAGWAGAVAEVEKISTGQMKKLVDDYLGEPRFNGFFAAPQAPDVRLDRREAVFELLPMMMNAGVRRRMDTPVEALCLLFPGRACAGRMASDAVSALFIMMENSEGGRELRDGLASIGARVQLSDNPYIPMDDYLVNPAWAFIRLEAPAGKMAEAALMLRRFLADNEVSQAELDAAAPFVSREAGIRSGHSSAALEKEVYKGLFPGHRFGEGLYRSPGRWAAPDSADVLHTRLELFQSAGAVVTLVTAMEESSGIDLLRGTFGDAYVSDRVPCPEKPDDYIPGTVDGLSPGSGAQLAAAWRIDGLPPETAAALAVAAEVLSRRMQLDIRETRGLAYSTGCSMTQVAGHAVVTASLGTRGENSGKAETALKEDIEGLAANPPTPGEIAAARSRLVSRLSRRELSCAGEALGIALDSLYRGGRDGLELITAVRGGEVMEMAGLLVWENALFVRLLPSGEVPEKKSMPAGMMRR